MAKYKAEGYWSKYHIGIIQTLLGLYVAALATWDRLHPHPAPTAIPRTNSAPSPPVGATVTPTGYVMPLWLWVGIVAFVLSVVIPAILKMIRGRKKPTKLLQFTEEGKEKFLDEMAKMADDSQRSGAQASLLWHFEAQAKHLCHILPGIWHDWNNSGQKLVHPLGSNEWATDATSDVCIQLSRAIADFYIQYRSHIDWLTLTFPGFNSRVIERGYPSDDSYHDILTDLQRHAELLQETADTIWKAEVPVESLNAKTT